MIRSLSDNYSIVTINVLYFRPDYCNLIGEFLWQTLDLRPGYPRIHRFLNYWHREIDAVIKEVIIFDSLESAQHLRHGTIFRI